MEDSCQLVFQQTDVQTLVWQITVPISVNAASSLGSVLPKICRAIMKATGAKDYNIIQNNGESAGQTVPHLHFHIIPRYSDSKHSFLWNPNLIDHSDATKLSKLILQELEL